MSIRTTLYSDMTDRATSIMWRVDGEIQAVAAALRTEQGVDIQVPSLSHICASWYPSQVSDRSTLTGYFRTNKGLQGIRDSIQYV